MCENKKRSVFRRESPLKVEMSFMLYRLSDTYLFDKYDKYVIYLLNFRLDLFWLGLKKIFFSCFFVSWIYFNNQKFTFPFINIYFFSCVIPIKNVYRRHYALRGCLFNRLISIFCLTFHLTGIYFRDELQHVSDKIKKLNVDQSELGKELISDCRQTVF